MSAGTGIGHTFVTFKERITAPATPSSTYDRLYFKADGLHYVNSAGTDVAITGTTNMTTSTNPGVSVATTTAIVDAYAGVIILQNDGTPAAQTIGSPTVTTAGKIFTVVNNDTSVESVVVNGFTITPGEAQSFIWDGTAWGPTDLGITALPVPANQGGTGLSTITDHGIMLGSGTGTVTPMAVLDTGQMVVGVTGADPTTVAANITTTKKFLAETGTGAVGATPVFDTIISGDLTTALTTPPAIGNTTPAYGRFSPGVNKGPAIINAPAGTVTTGGASSTTLTFSTTALAAQAGYSATAPVVGTTLIVAGPFTRYVVSWTNSTTCVLDSVVTLTDAAVTSIQLPIATFVDSSGAVKGWMNAAGNVYFVGNVGVGTATPGTTMELRALATTDFSMRLGRATSADYWRYLIDGANGVFYHISYNTTDVLNLTSTGNILTGGLTAAGTSAAKVLAIGEGTAPSDDPDNCTQLWSADVGGVALKNSLHMRDEAGNSGPIAFAKVIEYATPTGAITAEKLYGGQLNNTGQGAAITVTLPAAVLGMNFSVVLGVTYAGIFNIDPEASDSIYLDGVTTGDGKYVGVASAAIGNAIQFTTFTGTTGVAWFATTVSGAWAAEA